LGALARLASTVSRMTAKLDDLAAAGLQGWVEELAALHALQVQARALLDMMLRVAAELGYSPEHPSEAAGILVGEGIISREDYEFVRRVIGFRNIVVHEYASVDMELVRGILEGREYRRVAALAAKILLEAERRGLDP